MLVTKPTSLVVLSMGLFLLAISPVNASLVSRVALASNILVSDERVVFTQGTGSLTVLDLDTGKVLLRKNPRRKIDYHVSLSHNPHGVLLISYDRIMLLDKTTFEPIWQEEKCCGAVADDNYVCSHDGEHVLSCRRLQTGELCWKTDMDGSWKLLIAQGKVVVFTPDSWDRPNALQVFELESGRSLLHYQAAKNTDWMYVYFDGGYVYLVDQKPDSPRSKPEPKQITVLNLAGQVREEIDCNSPDIMRTSGSDWNGCFFWKNTFFSRDGHVRPCYDNESENILKSTYFVQKSLPNGVVLSRHEKDASGKAGTMLQMISSKKAWGVYVSHLGERGRIEDVSESKGKLLLGSSEGQVECLDIETGRARWIYVFPVISETQSFSSPYGLPPYLTQRADEYQRNIATMEISSGSVSLPKGFDIASANWSQMQRSANYEANVILDPSPDNPFPDFRPYYARLAILTLAPIFYLLLFLFVLYRQRKRSKCDSSIPKKRQLGFACFGFLCLFMSALPAGGLLEYGRLSCAWTMALKAVFALLVLGAAFSAIKLLCQHRWAKASLLVGVLLGWLYFAWFPWWFA